LAVFTSGFSTAVTASNNLAPQILQLIINQYNMPGYEDKNKICGLDLPPKRDTLTNVDLGFPQLVQDVVTTTEFCSHSALGCNRYGFGL